MEDRLFFGKDELGGDGFLSDMDEEPVDMEEIREGMKLVPLPDMLHSDIDRDAFPLLDHFIGQASDDTYRLSDSEADGNISGKAAKVAAQAAPDVLTGGVAAEESGPPPDFSLWTVEDDLLLKNAMEAGAAMEALAKGAMRFSRRYTVRELRERWRALLYDPDTSSKAAARMVEAETAFLESMRRMFPNKQKLQDFVHKRRQKSVRDTFYKRRRGMLEAKGGTDKLADISELDFGDSDFFLDPDDHAFSQMVDLLAAGGIGAVIGELSDLDAAQSPSSPLKTEDNVLSPIPDPEAATGKTLQKVEASTPETIVPVVTIDEKAEERVPEATREIKKVEVKVEANHEPEPQPYVVLSSDEEEDEEPEPKRLRASSPMQLMCTLNTHETDIPAFESPSSEEMPGSPGDLKGDATSDVKSSDCANYSGLQRPDLSYEDEYQSLEVASQTAETVERVVEDKYSPLPVLFSETSKAKADEDGHAEPPKADVLDSFVQADGADKQPEIESDTEMTNFSDVETMILDMDLDPGDNEVSARAESKRFYKQHQMTILRLEQSVGSAMQRYLTRKGAVAIFYGHHMEYLVRKNEVSLGRMTQGNVVDIDLGQEGPANKISRKQASIILSPSGVFHLKNLGKKVLYVNDLVVMRGERAVLTSNCLVEVSGMRFIFDINRRLTNQRVKEMAGAS